MPEVCSETPLVRKLVGSGDQLLELLPATEVRIDVEEVLDPIGLVAWTGLQMSALDLLALHRPGLLFDLGARRSSLYFGTRV